MRLDHHYQLPNLTQLGFAGLRIFICVLFLTAFWALINRLTHRDDHKEIFEHKNLSYAIERGGLLLGHAIAILSLVNYRTAQPAVDLLWLFGGGIWIMIVLLIVRQLVIKYITCAESNVKPGASDFLSVGITRAAFFVAAGLVINAGLSGSAPNPITGILAAIVFTAAGLLTIALVYIMNGYIPRINLHRNIHQGNLSAAWIAGGFTVALGYVMHNAISGDFSRWAEGLVGFGVVAFLSTTMFYLCCWLTDKLVLPHLTLSDIIRRNRTIEAAIISCFLVALAVIIGSVVI